jgi:hypothetical protein
MRLALGIIVGLLFIAALAYRIDYFTNGSKQAAAVEAASVPSFTHPEPPLGNNVTDYGPLSITGTAIMDYSAGLPAVSYISYIGQDNKTWTKQLIFMRARGCAPSAGDIPCVPGYPQTAAYPQVQSGQTLTVYGYIRDNRFLVESME